MNVTVHLVRSKTAWPIVATFPSDTLFELFQLLDVTQSDWLQHSRLIDLEKKWLPILPGFPLLSELSEIHVDNVIFRSDQVSCLQQEMDRVWAAHGNSHSELLAPIHDAIMLASEQQAGVAFSPFG